MTYADAVRQAINDGMAEDASVILMGQAVDDPKPTYGTTSGLADKFGKDRVFNTPLSEEGMTGTAIGMALAGLRPILVHIRMDFIFLSANQLINMAAPLKWMYGGRLRCPIVVRGCVGRSWGQGPQHSKGAYSVFTHIPGLKVAAPAFPGAAYLALRAAIRDDDPVIFVEHRLCHGLEGDVDTDEDADVNIYGQAVQHNPAGDVTLVGVSWMAVECLRAARLLADKGVRADVVVPTWLSPLDTSLIEASVARTGRLVIVDNSWVTCGLGSEIAARLIEVGLKVQLRRLGFAPSACPTSPALEKSYYPSAKAIAKMAYGLVTGDIGWDPIEIDNEKFRGPF